MATMTFSLDNLEEVMFAHNLTGNLLALHQQQQTQPCAPAATPPQAPPAPAPAAPTPAPSAPPAPSPAPTAAAPAPAPAPTPTNVVPMNGGDEEALRARIRQIGDQLGARVNEIGALIQAQGCQGLKEMNLAQLQQVLAGAEAMLAG